MSARLVTLALVTLASCDRGHHEPAPPPPISPAPAAGKACTLVANPPVIAKHRLVAIGDLHGDLGGTRSALRAANAIDDSDHWIGGDLVIVQTGDVLDRADDESQILDLLARLDGEARKAGGAVIQLLGNHELMNAAGDFRYVTPGGAKDFDGDRAHELAPGGVWAKRFAEHDVIAIVGDVVFSHAGVLGDWVGKVDATNLAARCWLDGQAAEPPDVLHAQDGPVWTRALGVEQVDCPALHVALQRLHARRMVVAHTVQPRGINSTCDNELWRIDVGLGKEYGGPIEVLELSDPPRVLTGSR